jgi:N-acetylglucosamine-6-phosphate deacetylase
MILLSGATLVLPDRLVDRGEIAIDSGRILEVATEPSHDTDTGGAGRDLTGHYIVPGFVDVHVHGVLGVDALDGGDAIATIAGHLPRFGVTAFCPTSIACPPRELREMLRAVTAAIETPDTAWARVLPAHLESNFINPAFNGAQPLACIRTAHAAPEGQFSARDVLDEIEAAARAVGIVTLAPEMDGVLDLIPALVKNGQCVSLGHSGASYEQARAGIAAGARQATHLFNRMTPLNHRDPGVVGAVFDSREVAAEIICDGVHVHPAAIRAAVAAKGVDRIMAITDGTGGSGMAQGTRAMLGGRPITVGNAAYLDDGTLAGSVLTMDRAFRMLVGMGFSLVQAARMCATTPARQRGLRSGCLRAGMYADFAVLDADLDVVETWIGGERVYQR